MGCSQRSSLHPGLLPPEGDFSLRDFGDLCTGLLALPWIQPCSRWIPGRLLSNIWSVVIIVIEEILGETAMVMEMVMVMVGLMVEVEVTLMTDQFLDLLH